MPNGKDLVVLEGKENYQKETALRTEVSWARILVKNVEMTKPSVINILEGQGASKSRSGGSYYQVGWEFFRQKIGRSSQRKE